MSTVPASRCLTLLITTTQCLFAGLIKLMISKGFLGCYPSAPWHLLFWSLPLKPRVQDRGLQGCATTLHPCQRPSQGYRTVSFYALHTCTRTHVYISRVSDIMQYFSYLHLVISHSIMSSRFIHVVANGKLNTFHSSTDRHLGLIPYHSYYD